MYVDTSQRSAVPDLWEVMAKLRKQPKMILKLCILLVTAELDSLLKQMSYFLLLLRTELLNCVHVCVCVLCACGSKPDLKITVIRIIICKSILWLQLFLYPCVVSREKVFIFDQSHRANKLRITRSTHIIKYWLACIRQMLKLTNKWSMDNRSLLREIQSVCVKLKKNKDKNLTKKVN